MKTPVRFTGAAAVLATAVHLAFHPTYATAVSPPPPGAVDEIDAVAALESLWAEQAQWIYETGYQGHDTFEQIQEAYLSRDAKAYARLTRQELTVARYLVSEECAVRQAELADYVKDSGGDGLEGLILTYHDCTAQSGKSNVRAIARLNAAQLQKNLWFGGDPEPNMHIRVAPRNLNAEKAVHGEAARATVDQLLAHPPDISAHRSLDAMLDDPFLQDELCGLPPRTTPDGGFSPAALLTMAACTATGSPGGLGTLEDMCQQLSEEASGQGGATPLTDSLGKDSGLTKDELGFLSDYCDNRSGGGGLPGSGNALDGFTEDECMPEPADDLAPYVDHMNNLEECFGTEPTDGNGPGGLMSGPGGIAGHVGAHLIVHAIFEYVYEKLIGEKIDYINEAADAGCYGAGVRCENDANGHPVCVENCPGEGGSSTSTGSDTTSSSGGDTTSSTGSETTSSTGGDTTSSTGTDTGSAGTGSSGTGASTPGLDDGGFDPKDPACEDLFGLGVLTPEGWVDGDSFWDQMFGRKPGQDPRKIYPNPDAEPGEPEGEECGPLGSSGYSPTGSGCQLPVTCPMSMLLEDDCSCGQTVGGAMPAFDPCINVVCPPDSTMASAGSFDCMCSAEAGGGELPPLPEPPVSGSVGVMSIDQDLVVEHMVDIMHGNAKPGAEPGFFGD